MGVCESTDRDKEENALELEQAAQEKSNAEQPKGMIVQTSVWTPSGIVTAQVVRVPVRVPRSICN